MERISAFNIESEKAKYTDTEVAWDVMLQAHDAIEAFFTPSKEFTPLMSPKKKKFWAYVTLAKKYDAEDAAEAAELAMNDIENRDGMDILKHEVIEDET